MKIEKIQYISFSLWGNKPLYTIGAIRNAELVKDIYPDWQMVVYYDDEVPTTIIEQLKSLDVELVKMIDQHIHPLFWRFFVLDRADCDRAIFRDTDSRVSVREKMAVDEWVAEDSVLHIMRDHPFHEIPYGANKLGILGGMWGMKGSTLNITAQIEKFVATAADQQYGIDQAFLESVYEDFYDNKTVHDEFFEGKKFPIKRKNYRFIGERIDENEQPFGADWLEIKKHEKKMYKGLIGFIKKKFSK